MVKRLMLLNGLAVFGVLFHHASGYGFRAMFDWAHRYRSASVPNYDQVGSLDFYANVLVQQLDAFTLPAFMFVSGFFVAFATGFNRTADKGVLIARLKTLILPFLFWTALYFSVILRSVPSSVDDVLSRYYYIPLLCQYYVLAPFLVPLVKARWKPVLLALVLVELLTDTLLRYLNVLAPDMPGVALATLVFPKWIVPNLMLWFTLGIFASLYRQRFTEWLARAKWYLLVACIVLGVLSMIEYVVASRVSGRIWLGPYFGGFARALYTPAFIFSLLAFSEAKIPFERELSQLGTKSLGIYLIHPLVMYFTAVLMYRLTPAILGNQLLYQGVLIVAGLAVPLLLMAVVGNSPFRRSYRYIFG